jgi:hypothetical protein
MLTIFLLLILFQIKHFLCDYPLQTPYMLKKFSADWRKPLTAHAGVHAAGTYLICLFFGGIFGALVLAMLDFTAHFAIDRAKVVYGSFPMEDKRFWWALGLDQAAHHLTHLLIIALLIL